MQKIPIRTIYLYSFGAFDSHMTLSFNYLKIHSCRKLLGHRWQRQEELVCDRSTQLAHVKGWCSGTPSALMDCTRNPGSRRSGKQDSPDPCSSFKCICGRVAGSPLSLPISQQQRLEARPAMKASRGLAVTGIVWLHLTHIHPPAMFPCSLGGPPRCTHLKPGLEGRGGGGRSSGRPGSIWLGKHRQNLNGQERELISDRRLVTQRHCTHTAQMPRGTHRAHTRHRTTDRSRCKVTPWCSLPPHPKQSSTDRNTAAPSTHPLAGAVCMALSSADFRKPEGEVTHAGRQGEGRARTSGRETGVQDAHRSLPTHCSQASDKFPLDSPIPLSPAHSSVGIR